MAEAKDINPEVAPEEVKENLKGMASEMKEDVKEATAEMVETLRPAKKRRAWYYWTS
jgi:hypothetical protein